MELVLAGFVLLAIVAIEPYVRGFVGDLFAVWRRRRDSSRQKTSEGDASAIFLRSRGGVCDERGMEWVLRAKSGRAWVELDGGAVGEPWRVAIAVEVDAHLDLEIRRPKFSKRLRVAAGDQHVAELDLDQPDIRFDVKRATDERGAIKDRLFSHAGDALTEPLATLLYRLGADEVIARNGRLGVSFTIRDMLVERLRDVLDTLDAVAAAYARRPEVVGLVERYLWLEGSSPRCPYCHVDLLEGETGLTSCARCKTVHHEACFAEHGGCTLLGCNCTDRRSI
ncbi:MAG: hypothetical protein ACAI25_06785 [Planctomycetota bacterium]